MNIPIIRATREDAPEILALQKAAYRSEAMLYNDWTIPPLLQTLPEIEEEFREKVFLKADLEGKIVGSVRVALDSGTCLIGRLIVDPGYQRRGIGSALLMKVEEDFLQARRFELFTGSKSVDNIRLYQRIGYRQYREEELSPKVRLVYMEKYR